MRFDGQRLSKNGETTVFQFSVGAKELRLMYDVLSEFYKQLPRGIMEMSQTRSRVNSILKEMRLQVKANKIKQ